MSGPRTAREHGDLVALAELRDTAREVAAEALVLLDIADGATEHDCAAVVVDALHDRGLLRRPADATPQAAGRSYDQLTEQEGGPPNERYPDLTAPELAAREVTS